MNVPHRNQRMHVSQWNVLTDTATVAAAKKPHFWYTVGVAVIIRQLLQLCSEEGSLDKFPQAVRRDCAVNTGDAVS
jgi:hypothetical protein